MPKGNLELGKLGQELAENFLRDSGYKILQRNYKTKLGEIDLIAKDRDTLCFIEVKTRGSLNFGLPQEAVNIFKQNQISKTALMFLKSKNLMDKNARFDVVSIYYQNNEPKIDLIKNAFSLNSKYTY
ncbi:MAG: YraN family protein [Candidatus Omnitrophota bacterium]